MKTMVFLFVVLCASLQAAEEIIPELRLLNGKLYKQVKVTKQDAAEIRVMHAEGFATVRLSDLTPEGLLLFGGKIDKRAESMADAERDLARARGYSPVVPVSAPSTSTAPAATSAPTMSAEENARRAWEWYQWCELNPQGDAQINAQQRNALLAQATQILQAWESAQVAQQRASQNAAAVAAQSGSLSTRPAVPVGRSYHDPERVAERAARQQMQQGAQGLTLDQFIAQAIQNRRVLILTYDNGADGARVVEPYLLGVTTAGHWAMQGYFREGASESQKGEGWRTYLLERITGIQATNEVFAPQRTYDGTGGGTFQSYTVRVQ